ncbi:MAG TPA: DNA repair protein RecO [Candidatus Saccharibacteria bacterium]|nr:DNA repair protein RecO [Candidatus Saccharibacteria bacterium]
MKTERTRAVVLRRTNYGEADRIVQLLTPLGRRSVMARGVRKEKSKLAGGIELFAVSDVVLGQGKGDLGILTSARLVQFYRHILEDYDRIQFGYEALKLVARASELVDEPEWYEVATQVLMALDAASVDLRLTQTWFYVHYADLLGHALGLQYDVNGEKLQPGISYRYDVGEKGLRQAENGVLTSDHIKLLRLIATKPLDKLAQIGGISEVIDECLLLAREHAAIS